MGALDPERYGEQLDELRQRFPGWQVWVSGPTWCARPWPLINASSAEELAQRIRTAHAQPPDGSPPLASLRNYTARARRLREFEEAVTAEWERRKAGQAAREVTATADPVQRFYQRHGHPAARDAEVTTPGPPIAAGDAEPGPA